MSKKQIYKLPNQLRISVDEMKEVETVSIGVFVNTGSRNENLKYMELPETKFEFAIVFPKNSKLLIKVNEIIDDMIDDNKIEKIEREFLREFDE